MDLRIRITIGLDDRTLAVLVALIGDDQKLKQATEALKTHTDELKEAVEANQPKP